MTTHKILIVDDEVLAVDSLKSKIISINFEADIKTECNPFNAIEIIKEWKPSILFLDISMPGISGFDLLNQLENNQRTFVLIFCTAHDEYALEAFNNYAIDYLVKPLEPERLKLALDKAALTSQALLNSQNYSTQPLEKLICSSKGINYWINVNKVTYFSSEEHETITHTEDGNEYFTALSLQTLQERLNPKLFFRSQRGFIINIDFIESFNSKTNEIKLTSNTLIPLSRRSRKAFKQFIKK